LISTPVTRPSWPPSGRKSTYPDVQFCQATSILYDRMKTAVLGEDRMWMDATDFHWGATAMVA
ncbi:hypothetical protein, partial [Sphingobium sp. YR768]|uniref:hypothetical protein n=1 Tax=Sphingobium sp. YR768 TaxID=1884365 RepID=UPI001C435031